MDLLEMLTGGGKNRQEYEDFVTRYDQGPPWEGYSDKEVLDRYGSVAHQASPSDYEQAAREAFSRLSPEQRAELARELQQGGQTKGINMPPMPSDTAGDLGWLSNATSQLHQQPGLLREILGGSRRGSAGGLLGSPVAKAALAGITAMLVKRAMGRSR